MVAMNTLNDKERKFIGYFAEVDIYFNQIKNYDYDLLNVRPNNSQTANLIALNI